MRAPMVLGFLVFLAAPAAAQERRCGWIQNPTPANWWLTDREGEWVLSVQGGPEVPGMDRLPDMTTRGWTATNGPHGFGCGCVLMETDRATRRVVRVLGGEPLPLARCRADRSLPPPAR